jgi:hypothetical protein
MPIESIQMFIGGILTMIPIASIKALIETVGY